MKHIYNILALLFVTLPGSLYAQSTVTVQFQGITGHEISVVTNTLLSKSWPNDTSPLVGLAASFRDANSSLITTDTSLITDVQQERIRKIIPRRATIRSLILPGWGQFYNRQYWKIPVIYTGLGVATAIYFWNSTRYNQYLTGYREAYNSTLANPQAGTQTAIVRGEVRSVQQLKQITDQFRRQRDLTILLTVLGWALNAVEANVAAHLKTFDISDDISMRVDPTIYAFPGLGVIPGIRVALTVSNR